MGPAERASSRAVAVSATVHVIYRRLPALVPAALVPPATPLPATLPATRALISAYERELYDNGCAGHAQPVIRAMRAPADATRPRPCRQRVTPAGWFALLRNAAGAACRGTHGADLRRPVWDPLQGTRPGSRS